MDSTAWEEVFPRRGGASAVVDNVATRRLTLQPLPKGTVSEDARVDCGAFLVPKTAKGGSFCDPRTCSGRHNFTLARLVSTRLLLASDSRDSFLLPACDEWLRTRRCSLGSLCVGAHPGRVATDAAARDGAFPEGLGQLCWDARSGGWARGAGAAAEHAFVFWDISACPFPSPRAERGAPPAALLLHSLASVLRTAIGVPSSALSLEVFSVGAVAKTDAAALRSSNATIHTLPTGADSAAALDAAVIALAERSASLPPRSWIVIVTGEQNVDAPAAALALARVPLLLLTCGAPVSTGEASAAIIGPADVVLMHAIHQGGHHAYFNNHAWMNKVRGDALRSAPRPAELPFHPPHPLQFPTCHAQPPLFKHRGRGHGYKGDAVESGSAPNSSPLETNSTSLDASVVVPLPAIVEGPPIYALGGGRELSFAAVAAGGALSGGAGHYFGALPVNIPTPEASPTPSSPVAGGGARRPGARKTLFCAIFPACLFASKDCKFLHACTAYSPEHGDASCISPDCELDHPTFAVLTAARAAAVAGEARGARGRGRRG